MKAQSHRSVPDVPSSRQILAPRDALRPRRRAEYPGWWRRRCPRRHPQWRHCLVSERRRRCRSGRLRGHHRPRRRRQPRRIGLRANPKRGDPARLRKLPSRFRRAGAACLIEWFCRRRRHQARSACRASRGYRAWASTGAHRSSRSRVDPGHRRRHDPAPTPASAVSMQAQSAGRPAARWAVVCAGEGYVLVLCSPHC